jgi:hypothetical protein
MVIQKLFYCTMYTVRATWKYPTVPTPELLPYFTKGKGKAIPLQAWIGPEGSRRMRLPDFMTIGT